MPNTKNKGLKELLQARSYLNRSRVLRLRFKTFIKDFLLIFIGIFSAAFGLESFLLPNNFIDGGATGISLLATGVFKLPLSLLILLVNIPFVFLGYKVIGKSFAIKASIAILGLAVVLATVHFPEVTQDKLLVAVFGGFFLGAGIGLSIRGGAVLDGTEVLAIYLSRKLSTKIGDIIILINIVIFLTAAYFLSVETALYSMLTYLSASKTLDFVVDGIEEYNGVTIISAKSEDVRIMITEKLGRGVTVYNAKGGYGKLGIQKDYDVIYTVVTRLEIRRLNIEVSKIDANAFIVMHSINDTRGGMIKKRHL
ncbi:YitT family protein [Cellulophaga baltica]|uniref:YitT family protein n=1 Tax=Cellulophaga TaxID=104264 RepID=UPI001C07BA3B|nr:MULTISPECIES: YitT family protein [Cellulophaga]MBU2995568.1 YitT family protein [Cellulophaga baltica]MDO6766962.1 YitT family protein [Cellulophaga sp. 1_MG-2023]